MQNDIHCSATAVIPKYTHGRDTVVA